MARAALWASFVLTVSACEPEPDPELMPDSTLRAELGLGDADRVHRVRLVGGGSERPDPVETVVEPGAWVEFVSGDWLLHEVRFDLDSLAPGPRAFLEASDQVASPPLIDRDSRFVVSFRDAPPGRYPFVLEGNGEPGRGAVVVREATAR